jgi:hypothetical protein
MQGVARDMQQPAAWTQHSMKDGIGLSFNATAQNSGMSIARIDWWADGCTFASEQAMTAHRVTTRRA